MTTASILLAGFALTVVLGCRASHVRRPVPVPVPVVRTAGRRV